MDEVDADWQVIEGTVLVAGDRVPARAHVCNGRTVYVTRPKKRGGWFCCSQRTCRTFEAAK